MSPRLLDMIILIGGSALGMGLFIAIEAVLGGDFDSEDER
jgi:hypothetical protein